MNKIQAAGRRQALEYSIVPMVLGFDGSYVMAPGAHRIILSLQPLQLFRVDRIYFDCDGLIIDDVQVGYQHQRLVHAPTSYYREIDEETKMKGRPFRFDTAEIDNAITFTFSNPTDRSIAVVGCLEGVTVL